MQTAHLMTFIIDALGDLKTPMPNGHLYAALMNHTDLGTYQAAIGALENSGLLRNSFDELELTPKGQELAAKIQAIREQKGKA